MRDAGHGCYSMPRGEHCLFFLRPHLISFLTPHLQYKVATSCVSSSYHPFCFQSFYSLLSLSPCFLSPFINFSSSSSSCSPLVSSRPSDLCSCLARVSRSSLHLSHFHSVVSFLVAFFPHCGSSPLTPTHLLPPVHLAPPSAALCGVTYSFPLSS